MRPPDSAPGRLNGPGYEMPPAPPKADDAQSMAHSTIHLQPLTEDLAELAGDLRSSRRHVEQMDRDGRLGPRAIRLGRRRVWLREEVRAWLDAGAPDRVTWLAIRGGSR